MQQISTPSLWNSKMNVLPVTQALLLLLLAGVLLPTEATKERRSAVNTILQAQPEKHHMQKVSHTEGWEHCRVVLVITVHWSVCHKITQANVIIFFYHHSFIQLCSSVGGRRK